MATTFADLITPAGIAVAAALIVSLVQLLKTVFTKLDQAVSGATLAFVLSAVLYVLTAIALRGEGQISGADGYLGIFLAWVSVAIGAVGIKSTFDHVSDVARSSGSGDGGSDS